MLKSLIVALTISLSSAAFAAPPELVGNWNGIANVKVTNYTTGVVTKDKLTILLNINADSSYSMSVDGLVFAGNGTIANSAGYLSQDAPLGTMSQTLYFKNGKAKGTFTFATKNEVSSVAEGKATFIKQ